MILVLNCGSQSIKLKVFDLKLKALKEVSVKIYPGDDYERILREELQKMKGYKIKTLCHRVVHGRDIFKKPVRINQEVLYELEKISHFAPLHNPYSLLGIKISEEVFSVRVGFSAKKELIPQYAFFDTEFFADLPEKSFTYALPQEILRTFGFRRYGFHGISHEYVARKTAEKINKPYNKLKLISCHLGGGSSIAAIKDGKAIDTSMGFTPMQGLIMMTRCGDMDPGIVLELSKKFGPEKTNEILNKESGIKGVCMEQDMLKVLDKARLKDQKARLALEMFVYSIQKYIGSYFAVLGGCDALVFTGSIGYGSERIRNMICKDLKILNRTKIFAIKTDEELAMAKKICKITSTNSVPAKGVLQ